MKNTLDILHVTFNKSPADKTVISVARMVNGKIYVLKMELGEQADILYRLLTEKTAKVEIKAESKEQDAISRRMVLDATVNKNSIWNNITNAKGENLEEIISQLPPINQMNKWIGAEVLDDIKADIERMIPCSKEALSMKLGVLDIIDKHMMESEEDENDKDN